MLPVASAGDGLVPAPPQLVHLRLWHVRCKSAFLLGQVRDYLQIFPEAYGQASQKRSALSGCLCDRRAHDRYSENVRLKLHESVVGRSAAIHAQLLQGSAGVGLNRVHEISDLIRNTLQGGTRNMTRIAAASEAENRTASV